MQTILRYLLLLPLLLAAWNSRAQAPVELQKESFENALGSTNSQVDVGNTLQLTTTASGSNESYYLRTSNNTVGTDAPGFSGSSNAPLVLPSGGALDGQFYWVGEGVKGTGSTPSLASRNGGRVTLKAVNVAGYALQVKLAIMIGRSPRFYDRMETDDTLRVQVRFNGTGDWETVGQLVGDGSAGAGAGNWRVDSNFNGSSSDDIALNTQTAGNPMVDFTFSVNRTGSTMQTRVVVAEQGGSEEFAFDNIRVIGTISGNSAPVLSIESTSLTYTEGDPATNVTSTLTITDVNDADMASAQVSISKNFDPSEDRLLFTNQNGITGAFSTGTGILSLSGATSAANYQAALRSVRYQNTDGLDPLGLPRTIRFVVTDPAGANSTAVERTIDVRTTLTVAAMPYSEDLTTDGEGTRYTSNFFTNAQSGSSAAFFRTNTNPNTQNTPAAQQTTFSNLSNAWYWYSAATAGNSFRQPFNQGYFQTQPINTTGYTNLIFNALLGARPGGFNLPDYLRISYRSNEGAWVLLGQFRGTGSASNDGTAGDLRQDLDVNNIGATPTGPALTAALVNFPFALPASVNGTRLDFKIETRSDVADEQIAFDLLQLTGIQLPTVTTKAATIVTGTSAVLGGDVTNDGGATITARGVVYSPSNTTPTISGAGVTQEANTATTNSFSETVAGLAAATTYYVRAYATNAAGTSYGNVQTFTTPTTVTSIVRASTNPTNAATVQYTVTFGASVTGVSTSNFDVSTTGALGTATVSSVSGSGTSYTVTVNTGSATGTGTLTLRLANATGISPGISTMLPFSGETYTIDKTAPTVAISSTASNPTSSSPILVTVTFSESVTGFVQGDLTVTNGTVSGFSGSGSTYTFNLTPSTAGTLTVNVATNVAQDAAGNGNTAATQFSIQYNQPTATVVSVTRLNPSPTATAQVRYRVVFSSSVSGLTTTNFSATGPSGASVTSVSGSGTTYTVTVNTGAGNSTLNLVVQNITGISPTVTNVPYTNGEQYTITKSFTAAPQLSIVGTGGTGSDVTAFVDMVQVLSNSTAFANALRNGSFEFHDPLANGDYAYQPTNANWTFNTQAGIAENGSAFEPTEPFPNGIAVAFIQSNGGSNGQIQQNLALPTGSNYQISFQASQRICCTTLDQTLNVFLNGVFLGSIQPGSSNYSTFTSATFAVTAPALTAVVSTTSASPTSTAPIPFSVSFSQSVGTTFTAADVTVSGGTLTSGSFSGSGSGPYTFTVTPSASGTISVSLATNVVQDANNTGNSASNTVSVQYIQPQTPATTVTTPANGSFVNTSTPTYNGSGPVSAVIRVYVDGVLLPSTVTSNSAGIWSILQPAALAQGSHTVYATAQRSGEAVSVNSNTNTFIVDAVRPSVAISSPAGASGTTTSTSPLPFTITFSEAVTGFVASDVAVTGGTLSGFSGSGAVYTFNVTPASSGTVTVNVPANVAQDAAGNGNTAATQFSIQYSQPQTAAPVVLTPANGATVADDQPTYSGVAAANSTVTMYVDGVSIGTSPATGGGNWSLVQPAPLASGSHTVYATAQLNGQTVSAASNTNTFAVSTAATYFSSTAEQPNGERVPAGSTNQVILRVAVVVTGGSSSPLSAESFAFTTSGSTTAADIAAARVYYTGTSNTFAATTLFGNAVDTPNGAFTLTGTQQLTPGTNYFWLVYDVAATAPAGNLLDATLTSLRVAGTSYTPSVTDPAGNRQIIRVDRTAGQALRLAGGSTAGYIDFSASPAAPAPLLTGAYSQVAWVKPALGTESSTYYVLGNGTDATAAPYIAITGDGRVEAGFGTGTTLRSIQTGPQTIAFNEWSQVAATFTGRLLTVYLNGEAIATLTSPDGPGSTRVNFVGSAGTAGNGFFPGNLDEVSQWNRALSITELRRLRHLTLSGTETGLVSYLQLNEEGATTIDAITGSIGSLTGASRIASTAPLGGGMSSLQPVMGIGAYSFTGTNTIIQFTSVSDTPHDVVVTRVEGTPLGTQVEDTRLRNTHTRAYWIVDKYSTGTFTANITYTLEQGLLSAGDATTPSNLKLYKRGSNSDGAFDAPISATAASAVASTVTFPVTSFSQTVIGTYGSSPLPVTLVRFRAERRNQDALLQWSTAQELNNAYFEVESSADGRTFQVIGRVTGQGTSRQSHQYQFTDANLSRYARPVIYYRLRQVDTNGDASLSAVQVVQVPQSVFTLTAVVFPNPATDQVSVRLNRPYAGNAHGWLFNAQGRLVQESSRQLSSETDLSVSVKELPTGVYTLRLVLDGQVLHQRIVVQR